MKRRDQLEVVIIGGGQAGLSLSYYLQLNGIEHLVLERANLAHSWSSQRWDSFRLVTQNWQNRLPGFKYEGEDPNGFMSHREVVQYLRDYRLRYDLPVQENTEVTQVAQGRKGQFLISTTKGCYSAKAVVVATGSFSNPAIPSLSNTFPKTVEHHHSSQYKNPESLSPGNILVVGGGQSGVQIAGELHEAGRKVFLALDKSYCMPRRYRGKDIMHWVTAMGIPDLPFHRFPGGKSMRLSTSPYISEKSNELQRLAAKGVLLLGRLTDVEGETLFFSGNLANTLTEADLFSQNLVRLIDRFIQKKSIDAPPATKQKRGPNSLRQIRELNIKKNHLSTVIWATGFEQNFSWIDLPIFDGTQYPLANRGITGVKGLYLLGLHWLHTLKSGSLYGVGEDAEFIFKHIQSHLSATKVKERRNRMGSREHSLVSTEGWRAFPL